MAIEAQKFRPSYTWMFSLFFITGTACAAIVAVVLERYGYTFLTIKSFTFLRVLCLVWLWALLCGAVGVWYLSFRVNEKGITGRTFWGRRRYLPWEDMNWPKPVGVFPLRFVRIATNAGGPALWLPGFVAARTRFVTQVGIWATEGHPLYRLLKR